MFSFCCKEEAGAQASHHFPACHLHRHWLLTPLNQMRSLLQNMLHAMFVRPQGICSTLVIMIHAWCPKAVPHHGPAPAKVLLRSGHDT